jgi:hypothetical protein
MGQDQPELRIGDDPRLAVVNTPGNGSLYDGFDIRGLAVVGLTYTVQLSGATP